MHIFRAKSPKPICCRTNWIDYPMFWSYAFPWASRSYISSFRRQDSVVRFWLLFMVSSPPSTSFCIKKMSLLNIFDNSMQFHKFFNICMNCCCSFITLNAWWIPTNFSKTFLLFFPVWEADFPSRRLISFCVTTVSFSHFSHYPLSYYFFILQIYFPVSLWILFSHVPCIA